MLEGGHLWVSDAYHFTEAYDVFFFLVLKTVFLFFERFLVLFASFDTQVHKRSDLPAHALLYEATYNRITLFANLTLGKSCMISCSGYVHSSECYLKQLEHLLKYITSAENLLLKAFDNRRSRRWRVKNFDLCSPKKWKKYWGRWLQTLSMTPRWG